MASSSSDVNGGKKRSRPTEGDAQGKFRRHRVPRTALQLKYEPDSACTIDVLTWNPPRDATTSPVKGNVMSAAPSTLTLPLNVLTAADTARKWINWDEILANRRSLDPAGKHQNPEWKGKFLFYLIFSRAQEVLSFEVFFRIVPLYFFSTQWYISNIFE
jgi:hypothetical protein